jgi:hypothetical protein
MLVHKLCNIRAKKGEMNSALLVLLSDSSEDIFNFGCRKIWISNSCSGSAKLGGGAPRKQGKCCWTNFNR